PEPPLTDPQPTPADTEKAGRRSARPAFVHYPGITSTPPVGRTVGHGRCPGPPRGLGGRCGGPRRDCLRHGWRGQAYRDVFTACPAEGWRAGPPARATTCTSPMRQPRGPEDRKGAVEG